MRSKLPLIGVIIGLLLIGAYPAYDAFYTWKNKEVVEQLEDTTSKMEVEDKKEFLEQAHAYNDLMANKTPRVSPVWKYEDQLSVEHQNVAFSELIIPKIAIDMPIYHGSGEASLSAGVGHVEESSLPVGGEDTHCILTAHSGMKGMRAFDDLRNMKKGDVFAVRTLNELYAYEVYDVETVLPEEVDKLEIEKGKDLCTLITCTPYGVNTHRLLVHGKRCKVPKDFLDQKPSVKDVVTNRRYAPLIIALIVILLLIIVKAIKRRKSKTYYKKHRGSRY